MARPSIKQERRNQILDACEICLVQYGVAGTTLDRVAETAGLARPLIRHNLGNRAALLDATIERFIQRSDQDLEKWLADLPETNPVATLVDWLFDPDASDPHFFGLSAALSIAAIQDVRLAKLLREWNDRFVSRLATIVQASTPASRPEDVETVAAGIAAMYLGSDSGLSSESSAPFRQQCKAAATRLIETLVA